MLANDRCGLFATFVFGVRAPLVRCAGFGVKATDVFMCPWLCIRPGAERPCVGLETAFELLFVGPFQAERFAGKPLDDLRFIAFVDRTRMGETSRLSFRFPLPASDDPSC
jgi:hypothetical protein